MQVEPSNQNNVQVGKKKWMKIFIIALIAIIVVAGGIWGFEKYGSKKQKVVKPPKGQFVKYSDSEFSFMHAAECKTQKTGTKVELATASQVVDVEILYPKSGQAAINLDAAYKTEINSLEKTDVQTNVTVHAQDGRTAVMVNKGQGMVWYFVKTQDKLFKLSQDTKNGKMPVQRVIDTIE